MQTFFPKLHELAFPFDHFRTFKCNIDLLADLLQYKQVLKRDLCDFIETPKKVAHDCALEQKARTQLETILGRALKPSSVTDKGFLKSALDRTKLGYKSYRTSGSSGHPLHFERDIKDTVRFLLSPLMKSVLLRRQPIGLRKVFSTMVSDRPDTDDQVIFNPLFVTGPATRFHIGPAHNRDVQDALQLLAELNPEVINSKPNLLEQLANAIRKHHQVFPRYVISSGGVLSAALKTRLEKVFQCEVIDAYIATETGYLASTCTENHFHLDTSAHSFERDEQGRLLISSLRNPHLPLYRYKIGDQISALEHSCPCGIPGPYIDRIDGRVIPQFTLQGGEKFSPTIFMNIFHHHPFLREYRLTQLGVGEFQLELDLDRPEPQHQSAITSFIQERFPEPIRIECHIGVIVKDSKFVRFINKVGSHADTL